METLVGQDDDADDYLKFEREQTTKCKIVFMKIHIGIHWKGEKWIGVKDETEHTIWKEADDKMMHNYSTVMWQGEGEEEQKRYLTTAIAQSWNTKD